MRILFLSTWFPYPPDNGSKIRVYHLLRALAQRHEVTLLSFAWDTAQPEAANELHSWCADVQVVPLDPFAANSANALKTFLSLRPMAFRPLSAMTHLVKNALTADTFDAVIVSTEMMADYAFLLPSGAVRILEEHNSISRWSRENYENATGAAQRLRCWLSWKKRLLYEAHFYRHFDLITMVSNQDHAATMAVIGPQPPKVGVVPNGVDCTHNCPGLAAKQPARLIYNGSLTYNVNYDAMQWFLAEIYPLIKARVPDISLTITGSTRGVDLAGLILDDSVRLTGFVADVRQPVAEAAVCVVPIRRGGGTRLKILEAMALGTPVVTTPKGAEGLDVIDGVHLLIADSAETFAQRTLDLLCDSGLRDRLAEAARSLVEQRYDWSIIGGRFADLVEAIVQDKVRI